MGFFLVVAIYVATFILKRLLVQKPERQDKPLEFPTVEEGRPIPIVFGQQEIAPQIVWYGDVAKGGGDQPNFYARMHAVLCWGPVDAWLGLSFDKVPVTAFSVAEGSLPLWRGAGDDEVWSRLDINAPDLFGGKSSEGGPFGPTSFYWGAPGTASEIGVQVGDVVSGLYDDGFIPDGEIDPADPKTYTPHYPGLCHIIFGIKGTDSPLFSVTSNTKNFGWARNSPYMKPITFLVARYPNPPALLLAKAPDLFPALPSDVNIAGDANPIAALYELLTDQRSGVSIPPGQIDTVIWRTAAQTMVAEQFGLSFTLADPESAAAAAEDILTHIDGVLRENPRTGLVEVKLLRDDFDPLTIPVVDATNAREMRISRGFWPETFNESRIRFREIVNTSSRKGAVDAAATAQNLANWQATGSPRVDDQEFKMLTNPALAALVSQRRLRATSLLLAKASWKMNREGFDLMRGDVVRLVWPSFGVASMVVRIASIDYGSAEDRTLQIDGIEDVFSVSDAVYVAPPPTGWTAPVVGDGAGNDPPEPPPP